jgi:hypothetical protein
MLRQQCASFPAVLYSIERWRRSAFISAAWPSSSTSFPPSKCWLQLIAWVPVGVREIESLLGLLLQASFSWLVALRRHLPGHLCLTGDIFSWSSCLRWAPTHYTFPSRRGAHQLAGRPHHCLAAAAYAALSASACSPPFFTWCAGAPPQGQAQGGRRLLVGAARLASAS